MRMCSQKGCIMSCIRFQECKFIKKRGCQIYVTDILLKEWFILQSLQSYWFYNTISITINFVTYDC